MRKLSLSFSVPTISDVRNLANKGFDKLEEKAQARQAEAVRKEDLRIAQAALARKQEITLSKRSEDDLKAIIANLENASTNDKTPNNKTQTVVEGLSLFI